MGGASSVCSTTDYEIIVKYDKTVSKNKRSVVPSKQNKYNMQIEKTKL